jgi:hypothetical protein
VIGRLGLWLYKSGIIKVYLIPPPCEDESIG